MKIPRYLILIIPILSLLACGEPERIKLSEPTAQEKSTVSPLQLDLGGHKALIMDLVFTPDGRSIVSAGLDKVIRVWDLDTGEAQRGQIFARTEGKVYAMALSPDGRWLAAGGMMATFSGNNHDAVGTIRLYNFTSGELVAQLLGHTNVVLSLAFSPDSRYLVSGSADKNAILWDVSQKRRLHTLHGHTDDIYAVAVTNDSKRVVTGSLDHHLRLWQLRDGELIATLKGHTDKVYSVAISQKYGTIASGSDDHTIRLWNGQRGHFIKILANQGTQVGSLSFSPDGRYLVSSCGGGGCSANPERVWSIADGKELTSYSGHDNIVLATAVSPSGLWAATGGGHNQEIHIWTLRDGKLKQRLSGVGASTWAVGFSADGRDLAWGKTFNQQATLQNRLGPLEYSISLPTLDSPLGAPRPISQNGGDFIRALDRWGDWTLGTRSGKTGQNAILEIRHQNRTVASIERDRSNGYDHRSYTFTPDGQGIISGGMNGVLFAYNSKGEKIGEYVGHTGDVWAVAVSPDGLLLASASWDQTVRLWDVQSRENLLSLFFGNDGEWVAWTPSGHYSASPNGGRFVGWQINRGVNKAADYVSADQLRQYLYRPDIVTLTVRMRSVKQALAKAGLTDFNLDSLIRD